MRFLAAAGAIALGLCAQDVERYYGFPLMAGTSDLGNYGSAFQARTNAESITSDPAGNLYFPDFGLIRKIGLDGVIVPLRLPIINQTVFGTRYRSIASDREGNLYVYDQGQGQVLRISTAGRLEVWLSREAIGARAVLAIAAASPSELYLVDFARVWRIGPDCTLVPFAGTGTLGYSGDGGPATQAMIYAQGIAVDNDGTVYLGDTGNDRVRAIDRDGIIRTVAGVSRPVYILPDGNGDIYVSGSSPSMIYKVNEERHSVQIVAGSSSISRYGGDGGPAVQARLAGPRGLALDPVGNLYFADVPLSGPSRIRRISPAGIVNTVAGCGCGHNATPLAWDDLADTFGAVADQSGNLYYSDRFAHQVLLVDPNGIQVVVAGNGESGFSGDGGPATAARLAWPAGLALDSSGNLYIADEQNNRVRVVNSAGVIRTVAGNGVLDLTGDGGNATGASLAEPDGIAVDGRGNLYIADTGSHRVRKVSPDGIIVTVAGSGEVGSAGDGGPAINAQLINPRGVAIDTDGGVLISDSSAHRVRKLMPDGTIRTIAGTGEAAVPPGVEPPGAITSPYAAVPDGRGSILIAETGLGRIRRLDTQRSLHTVDLRLSNGTSTISLFNLRGIAVRPDGNLIAASGGLTLISTANASPIPLAPSIGSGTVRSAAGGGPAGVVAPGEILSTFGGRLGPEMGVAAVINGGSISTVLAGVRVLFDGMPAPILYADSQQINTVVPFEIAGRDRVTIETEFNGSRSKAVTLPVLPVVPSFFTSANFGNIAAINQDGTINSSTNPAPAGSVIALYATGGGVMTPPLITGQIAGSTLSNIGEHISAAVAGIATDVSYAGSAPGLIAGALQINIRVPAAPASSMVTVTIADATFSGEIRIRQ